MDRFARALDRARQPSGRERAALFLVGGIALVLYGISEAAIPPVMPWGIALRTVVEVTLLLAVLHPRLTHALVEPREGSRPGAGKVLSLTWQPVVILLSAAITLISSWWIRGAAVICMTVVARSPFYALFLGVAAFSGFSHKALHASLGLACLADGLVRWYRAGRPHPPELANQNLAADLLALIDAVGPVDENWLERSSGLDTPQRVADSLRQIRAQGLLAEPSSGICDVSRDE